MKKKKGFTLVELLAVIVVLAIIAIIAVPTILGVIDKAKKGSLQDSGYGLVEAANLYYAQHQNGKTVRFDIEDNEIITEEENKLNYKGNIKNGTVLINQKGQVTVCINDGNHAAYKNYQDTRVTVVDKKTCTIPESSYIVYLDGEKTIKELTNEELTNEIENLKQLIETQNEKIEILESEKSNQSDVTNFINNLTTTHNSDVSSINTRLNALTTSLSNVNKYYSTSTILTSEVLPNTWTTVCKVTVPTGNYMVFGNVGLYSSLTTDRFFGFWLYGGVQGTTGLHYFTNNTPYNYANLSDFKGCSSTTCDFELRALHMGSENHKTQYCYIYAVKAG